MTEVVKSSAQKFGSGNACRWVIACSFNGAEKLTNPSELVVTTVLPELAV